MVNVFYNPGDEGAQFDYGYRGAPSYVDLGFDASEASHRFAIDWSDFAAARDWYAKVKSRPSFRPLLADRVRGLSPVSHYADLDF